jgi:Ca-activated chloride channel family protein
VTALYEIIPAGKADATFTRSVPLKYSRHESTVSITESNDLLHLSLRYKKPDENQSRLVEKSLEGNLISLRNSSANFRLAAAVAEFGLLLRKSNYSGTGSFDEVMGLTHTIPQNEKTKEFISLVEKAKNLQ